MNTPSYTIAFDDPILITGAGGYIGSRVVKSLIDLGFSRLRCLVRESTDLTALNDVILNNKAASLLTGTLLSLDDCRRASENVAVVFHLAAGMEKTFAGCYMNSVVATRNLLDALLAHGDLKRFVNVSSIAVYSKRDIRKGGILDEACAMDKESHLRHEAYVYGKVKQDELLLDYARRYHIPYVIVRPGEVFGPGKRKISGLVGIDTFGAFLHLGGQNKIPFTYVENCAEAIVLAGLVPGVNGQVFNIIDDDLPTSRMFLKMYKQHVRHFSSVNLPYRFTYFLCYLWERYSGWSDGQLPPVFNRRKCIAAWKPIVYSNRNLKDRCQWKPRVPMDQALKQYFTYMKAVKDTK